MRILLVEDDAMLADAVRLSLTQSAHAVDLARNGEDAERAFTTGDYGLVILDVALPKMNGFEVLRCLRRRRLSVPVLMLTVNDSVEDRVMALDLGADDYLTKPFHLAELEARVRALIRRAHSGSSSTLTHGRLRLDMAGRRLYCDDAPLELSARELAVIELLLLRERKVVTKQQIVDHLYGWEEGSTSNTIEVFIHRLRKKLEPFGLDIRTIRGMGYLVDSPNGE
ncbi:MAG TPA: response regulator transcription factor [Burkholderiales bacterium]|nr:response regulator transcription factor [Burkholderiales bacterium]